jgi:hypothetical protein
MKADRRKLEKENARKVLGESEQVDAKIAILDGENGRVILTSVSYEEGNRTDLEEEVAYSAEAYGMVGSAFEWIEYSYLEDYR